MYQKTDHTITHSSIEIMYSSQGHYITIFFSLIVKLLILVNPLTYSGTANETEFV